MSEDDEDEFSAHIGELLGASGDDQAMALIEQVGEISSALQYTIASCAIWRNRIAFLRWFLERTRHFLNQPQIEECQHSRVNQLLSHAAGFGNLSAVQVLVSEFGADVGFRSNIMGTDVLSGAVNKKNEDTNDRVELVQWLLDHGRDPNKLGGGCYACFALMTAAHQKNLPMVKLLVERGGLINALNAYGLSPLTYAQMGGSQEVIDYLRSVGAKEPWEIRGEPPPPPPPPADSITHHFRSTLGCQPNPFAKDIVQPDLPTIHLLQQEEFWVLATEGMSNRPMNVPAGDPTASEFRFAELFIRLPEKWPVDQASMAEPKNRWVLDWLFRIASWPFDNNSWLGPSAVFANGEPPEPIAEGMPFTCFLVTPTGEPFGRWEVSKEKIVHYYWVYPIFTEEREFERAYGTRALLEKFAERGCPLAVDPARPNVAIDS
jgi:uncharacterized protein